MPAASIVLWLAIGAALVSAVATRIAIAYSRRRALVDHPGGRRVHLRTTLRGGGIAIAVVLFAGGAVVALAQDVPASLAGALAFGLLLVAGVGWIDDHRGLSARVRLLAHFIAAAVLVSQLPLSQDSGTAALWLRAVLQVLLLATAINFWNFMDGANGLLTTQCIWIGGVLAVCFGLASDTAWQWMAAILAGACVGFLPFNFPRARIFMGDVGSGALGFACGALLLVAEARGALDAWAGAVIASALLGDAALTLLHRMLRGRRWYTAHREHLYQWLVRSGRGHAQVTTLYLGWNFLLVLPMLWVMRSHPSLSPVLAMAVAFAALVAWSVGKRLLLAAPKRAPNP